MTHTTKQHVEALVKDNQELRTELAKLAEAHNGAVAAINRLAGVLGNLGNDIRTGMNQQNLASQALIATTSELLAKNNIVTMAEWETTLEFNYDMKLAAARQEIERAAIAETEATMKEAEPASSLILP